MTDSKPPRGLLWKRAKFAGNILYAVAALSVLIAIVLRGKPFDWRLALMVSPLVAVMVGGAVWLFRGPIMRRWDRSIESRMAETVASEKRKRAAIEALDRREVENWAVWLMRKEHNDPATDEDRTRLARMKELPESLRRFFAHFASAHVDGFGTTISQHTVQVCEEDPRMLRIGDGPDGDEVFVERATGRVVDTMLNEDFPLDLSDAHASVFHWIVSVHTDSDPRCFKCGYTLRGLPDFRCPECGYDSANNFPELQGRKPDWAKRSDE